MQSSCLVGRATGQILSGGSREEDRRNTKTCIQLKSRRRFNIKTEFCKHARQQLAERNLSAETAINALEEPQQILQGSKEGRKGGL